ncbi:MAG: hypothetical protein NT172_09585 [Planctomycetota bacterium]|nr:hypothetical protein [Planctomycetota bacterium]
MPNANSNELARLPMAGSDFSWTFFATDDRLGHSLQRSNLESPLIQSVDLKPELEENGPASPVFQHLHEEHLPQGLALMGVGQWGKIHFSGVFMETSPGRIHCDIAARVRTAEPIALASTYTVARTSSDIVSADGSEILLNLNEPGQILRIVADKGSQLVMAEAGRSALRIQILPRVPEPRETYPSATSSRTIPWSYTIELVNSAKFV